MVPASFFISREGSLCLLSWKPFHNSEQFPLAHLRHFSNCCFHIVCLQVVCLPGVAHALWTLSQPSLLTFSSNFGGAWCSRDLAGLLGDALVMLEPMQV